MEDEINDEEEEDEKSIVLSITPLPNRKYRAELARLGGMALDEFLSCLVSTDLYEETKIF
jgi:hypothetical protein